MPLITEELILFEDPRVVAAIVAGLVSLIVSAISGLYTIAQNRNRFEILKNEILAKSDAELFVKAKEEFLNSYRKFEPELVAINERNPHDGTEVINFAINFYVEIAKDFYLRNKSFLQSTELSDLLNKITKIIESGALNDTKNHSGKREFGEHMLSFCSKLNELALNVHKA